MEAPRTQEGGDVSNETEDRVRKLKKLLALAEHPNTEKTVADAARARYEALVQQWEIDPASLESESVREWRVLVPSGCFDYFAFIAQYLEIVVSGLRNRRTKRFDKKVVILECGESDYKTARAIMNNFAKIREQKMKSEVKRARLGVESYLLGVLDTNFPKGPLNCPECGRPESDEPGGYRFDSGSRRFKCDACGYASRRERKRNIDLEKFASGAKDRIMVRPDHLLPGVTTQ
jgi:hypothetical protein